MLNFTSKNWIRKPFTLNQLPPRLLDAWDGEEHICPSEGAPGEVVTAGPSTSEPRKGTGQLREAQGPAHAYPHHPQGSKPADPEQHTGTQDRLREAHSAPRCHSVDEDAVPCTHKSCGQRATQSLPCRGQDTWADPEGLNTGPEVWTRGPGEYCSGGGQEGPPQTGAPLEGGPVRLTATRERSEAQRLQRPPQGKV